MPVLNLFNCKLMPIVNTILYWDSIYYSARQWNIAILMVQHGQYGNSLVTSYFITSIKLCNFRKRDVKASSDEDLTFVVEFLG